jgi:xylulokinase
VTGKPVRRSRTSEATALGAGILAAAGTGLFSGVWEAAMSMSGLQAGAERPVPARHEIYTRLYQEVYRGLFPAVRPYLDRLAELTIGSG